MEKKQERVGGGEGKKEKNVRANMTPDRNDRSRFLYGETCLYSRL